MRIGIDARFLTHPQPGGFKTYTENLVAALACVDNCNEYYLYVDRQPSSGDVIPHQANVHTRVVKGFLPLVGAPYREQFGLPRQAAADRVDLFHAPCLTAPLRAPCLLVVTVHDMIWAFPERFSQQGASTLRRRLMTGYNRVVPWLAAKRASAIITVSHAARGAILDHLGVPPEKVSVTWEAARSSFRPVADSACLDAVRGKFGLDADFVLAIGSADPRKNIGTLLQGYALLTREVQSQYHLAIVWTHPLLADAVSRRVRELRLERNVHFLQSVTNEDLVHLYNAASLFVFPSLYEGFGLPVLEAMACGTPVIASNTSSIPEIAGDAALLFEPDDTRALAEAMTGVLTDDEVRSGLVQKGLQRNAAFSWETCARETLSVYRKVVSQSDSSRCSRVR